MALKQSKKGTWTVCGKETQSWLTLRVLTHQIESKIVQKHHISREKQWGKQQITIIVSFIEMAENLSNVFSPLEIILSIFSTIQQPKNTK